MFAKVWGLRKSCISNRRWREVASFSSGKASMLFIAAQQAYTLSKLIYFQCWVRWLQKLQQVHVCLSHSCLNHRNTGRNVKILMTISAYMNTGLKVVNQNEHDTADDEIFLHERFVYWDNIAVPEYKRLFFCACGSCLLMANGFSAGFVHQKLKFCTGTE